MKSRSIFGLAAVYCACLVVCTIDCSSLWAAMTTGGAPTFDALGRQHASGVIGLLGRLHPLVVHFPIALIVMACVAEAFFVWKGNASFGFAARFMLYAAILFAFVAVLLGIAAASGRAADPTEIEKGVGVHGALGMITTGLIALTAGLAARATQSDPLRTLLYRIMLVASMILVIFTAHTGAMLVFGPRYISIF